MHPSVFHRNDARRHRKAAGEIPVRHENALSAQGYKIYSKEMEYFLVDVLQGFCIVLISQK